MWFRSVSPNLISKLKENLGKKERKIVIKQKIKTGMKETMVIITSFGLTLFRESMHAGGDPMLEEGLPS